MRVSSALWLAAILLLGGCSMKNIRVGGMMCPEGYTQEQIDRDMRECRFYGPAEDEAAAEAAFPKEVKPECVKCLEERGYKITE